MNIKVIFHLLLTFMSGGLWIIVLTLYYYIEWLMGYRRPKCVPRIYIK